MGANPPVTIIEGFIKRIWKDLSVDKLGMVSKRVFLVRFQNENDRDVSSDMSGILFDKKPFVVKPWSSTTSVTKESLKSLLVWVKFPSLLVKYWRKESLSLIAGLLGPVLRIVRATMNYDRLMYAGVLVELDITEPFPEEIHFTNQFDELVAQKVTYDWYPVLCTKCHQLSHKAEVCRIGVPRPTQTSQDQTKSDSDGFQLVTKGKATNPYLKGESPT